MAIQWVKLLNSAIKPEVQTKVLPTKGNLVYEYNPFRNYRLNKIMFEYNGEYYTEDQLLSNFNIRKINNQWRLNYTDSNSIGTDVTDRITLHEKGELVDFITDELQLSINHPVHIVPQYSYDGSVNLIINDGVNIPRMINSRFSATGRNTYEVVDRKGNNDTNIYDQGEQFDIDTSLYKRVIKIPKIEYKGDTSGGNLKVGNYHFYFKLSDADGNETDFVGETGLVSIFIGFQDPHSITTGEKNQNSFKSVQIVISNIDTAYNYVYAYYSRYTAQGQENDNVEYIKIDKKFVVNNSGICTLLITGFEDIIPITAADINLNYNIVDAAKTSTTCQNMLFLGNVHKPDIPYRELEDLSLRFLPFLKQEVYSIDMDEEYNITTYSKGYYDSKFIHDKTGYWGEEIYRLGIVYIMPNNELTPVFNIRGAFNVEEFGTDVYGKYNDGQYSNIPVFIEDSVSHQKYRNYIQYNDADFTIVDSTDNEKHLTSAETTENTIILGSKDIENVKGVVRFKPSKDADTIYSLDIRVDDDTISELKKYVKGYFFVRQTRIPTILAQGITIGIDQNAFTPCVPTADGYLNELSESLEKTHVTTEDINDVNYISEGFLTRYSFKFKKKSSGLWGIIGKALAVAVGVTALAAATVFTCGAAGVAIGGVAAGTGIAGGVTAVSAAVGTVAGAIGMAELGLTATSAIMAGAIVAGTGAIMATAALGHEAVLAISRTFHTKKLDGRNTKVPSGYKLVETDDSRLLKNEFLERIIIKDPTKVKVQAILCPDYEVNQAYYNSIFTGNTHKIKLTQAQCINALIGHSSNYFTNNYRHFYVPGYYDTDVKTSHDFKIIGVPDDVNLVGIGKLKFRSRAGYAEEAWQYECVGDDYKSEKIKKVSEEEDSSKSLETDEETLSNKKINTDIVRGSYGPYLAFNDENNKFQPAQTVNIFIPDFSESNMDKYFQIRMQDNTQFSAISERFDINDSDDSLIKKVSTLVNNDTLEEARQLGYSYNLYRGDCYICQFTHRMHRNFQDPSAPYNDEIIKEDCWKEGYDPEEPDKYLEINLGDVNAVQIGTWVTFRVRSSCNLNIRTLDASDVTETAMTGHPRGYYPYNAMEVEGTYKVPDSQIYNKGFRRSLSERWNFELPDVPHIKNWFGTRIMYSDIHINDAYKNGFRVFKDLQYRDYTREYGEIVKLITLESDIICVFEHGVARIPVTKTAVAQQVQTGNNYITTQNVLPEAPIILSDMYGSQWADSVLKTPGKSGDATQYIYGVDTVAKKIWRTNGQTLECISDFKVQEFLNNNITLGERELTPILGVRNVKTCYNAYKKDVMFTFYDNTYGFEEKVWNLCYSELLNKFITFYSWVPSFMENINNIPFSFDRNVSKWIAKLGTSHTNSSFADGITLSNVVINNYKRGSDHNIVVDNFSYTFNYISKGGETITITREIPDSGNSDIRDGYIGVLSLSNRVVPENLFYTITYELERDPFGNYKNFEIKQVDTIPLGTKLLNNQNNVVYDYTDSKFVENVPIYALYFHEEETSKYRYIYHKLPVEEANLLYVKPTDTISTQPASKVHIKKASISPEVLMSEIYYRNKAGHAYADYDDNKIIYNVNEALEENDDNDNSIFNIVEVMLYVARRWYHMESIDENWNSWTFSEQNPNRLELHLLVPENLRSLLPPLGDGDKWEVSERDKRAKTGIMLLEEYGGPFKKETIIYLRYPGREQYYACSGNLGDMVLDHPNRHAPFTEHFLYRTFVEEATGTRKEIEYLPPFKDLSGKRLMLPKDQQINPDKIVALLNIRATVNIIDESNAASASDTYFNMKASYNRSTPLINAAQYESVVAVTTKWNTQFLTHDFWKHGQAGIIDIADDIYPTYWYGKQHPFEFECLVVDDPSVHKIFTNLELVANKAKPESFHYEVVGETYDFAKDKPNMYFRQEALKALWQYNGADIMYDRNFLKVQPRQQPKSANLIHRYYTRQDTINEIEDYYIHISYPTGYDYRHLSGSEIVYYPTRQEFRVWTHQMAVDINDLSSDNSRAIIAANCHYLEDRWKVTINPIVICYRNEYKKTYEDNLPLIHPNHSIWPKSYDGSTKLPPLAIYNSPIPNSIKAAGKIDLPGIAVNATTGEISENSLDRSNALYHLYDLTNFGINGNYMPLDTFNWLNEPTVYRYNFGEAHNRREIDIRDKFIKIRIRYSGEELAIIDFLNTIYQISYA